MTKSYIKDYPRPQLVRNHWENLNGTWNFQFDDQNIGETQQWFTTFPNSLQITVPFTYETKLSGIEDTTIHPYIWYQKKITFSSETLVDKKIMLHFEGADYITKLWVNGIYIGCHTGGYSRFSFDISKAAVEGDNNIVVKIEDYPDDQQPRGKQRWIKESYACWYIQTTGIWKTVWVEYLPQSYIEQVKMTPNLSQRTLELEIDVQAKQYSPNLLLQVEITFDNQFVNKVLIPVYQKHLSTKINLSNLAVTEWQLYTWSPEHPNLYDISFELVENNVLIDQVLSYFGMREISIDKNQILLNGRPIYQRLILDQGYWKDSHLTPPDEQALIEDIDKIMALGYNGVRKHQKIEDERFLYWCDVKGLYVWSEMAAAYTFSDFAVETFAKQWMEIVLQNYNHPSIITWTPFNESWGIPNIKNNRSQQHFTEAIYHLTKCFDPNRPIVINDGWEHTISDIITLHDYEAEGELLFKRYFEFKDEILSGKVFHNLEKAAIADNYSYQGQPIIISEFGGIALDNDQNGWGYGNKVSNESAFLERFDSITTAIKQLPFVCGYCYTQVTDVQQEINGLMDIDRNFKVNSEEIKKINEREVHVIWKQNRD